MSLLTHYFVATADDVLQMDADAGPAETFPTVRLAGVDPAMLQTLDEILTGTPDRLIAPVAGDEDEGPWIFGVPPALTRTLANLDEHELPETATQWSETDEWQLTGSADPETVADVLLQLSSLAQIARDDDKQLFLWMSL